MILKPLRAGYASDYGNTRNAFLFFKDCYNKAINNG